MKSIIVLFLTFLQISGHFEERDFQTAFHEFGVDGSFLLYDLHADKYLMFNPGQIDTPFLPASTFKIFNSLVSLETGAIPDENAVIKWDGVVREIENWNHDTDLKDAFKNSTVWFYQELARRVGAGRMKKWLDDVGYGNADTSGGVDRFWLTGGLRITPREQIGFLVRLYKEDIPFSTRTIETVKRIMIAEEFPAYVLRAKTGWTQQNGQNIGWYVGYLERDRNVYFFATCIQCETDANGRFAESRVRITRNILHELHLL